MLGPRLLNASVITAWPRNCGIIKSKKRIPAHCVPGYFAWYLCGIRRFPSSWWLSIPRHPWWSIQELLLDDMRDLVVHSLWYQKNKNKVCGRVPRLWLVGLQWFQNRHQTIGWSLKESPFLSSWVVKVAQQRFLLLNTLFHGSDILCIRWLTYSLIFVISTIYKPKFAYIFLALWTSE